MKKFLIAACFLFPLVSVSQQLPLKDGKIIYEVIDFSVTATKSQLFIRAKTWFTKAFKSSPDVIQLEDASAGEIIGKGNFTFGGLGYQVCHFTIKCSVRDNKHRLQFFDLALRYSNAAGKKPLEQLIGEDGSKKKTMQKNIDEQIQSMITDYKEEMNKQGEDF